MIFSEAACVTSQGEDGNIHLLAIICVAEIEAEGVQIGFITHHLDHRSQRSISSPGITSVTFLIDSSDRQFEIGLCLLLEKIQKMGWPEEAKIAILWDLPAAWERLKGKVQAGTTTEE